MLDSLLNPLRKPRPDCLLNNLPQDQQRRILDWLASDTYMNVIKKIAAPAPEGFGLTVHYTSLRRFWQRHLAAELHSQRADTAHLRSFSRVAERRPTPYTALTREALERYSFQLALSPNANPDVLLKLNQFLLRLRNHDITAQKFAWEVEARNAARDAAREQQEDAAANRQAVDSLFTKLLAGISAPPATAPEAPQTDPASQNSSDLGALEHEITRANSPIAQLNTNSAFLSP